MATAAEKEALGLSADASEEQVVEAITTLKTNAEEAEIKAKDAESDRDDAEKELAAERERLEAEKERIRDEVREEFKADIERVEGLVAAADRADAAAGIGATPGEPEGTEVTIKIRAFPYYTAEKDPVSGNDVRREHIAVRGETVKLSAEDLARAEKFNAIATEADEEVAEATSASSTNTATVEELSRWLTTSQPTEEETVDAAEDDPVTAQKLLDAENHATGGQPRDNVVSGLTEIINGQH